jgi:hypothetical protein
MERIPQEDQDASPPPKEPPLQQKLGPELGPAIGGSALLARHPRPRRQSKTKFPALFFCDKVIPVQQTFKLGLLDKLSNFDF